MQEQRMRGPETEGCGVCEFAQRGRENEREFESVRGERSGR